MKHRYVFFIILLSAVLLASTIPSWGLSGDDGIQVTGADKILLKSAISSQELIDVTNDVTPRTVVQYANRIWHINLSSIPAELDGLLQRVQDRIIIQHANTNQTVSLIYPEGLFNPITITPSPTPTATPTMIAHPFDSPIFIPLITQP